MTDIYDIRKLNIGSSVNFLKIEHKPELKNASFAFFDHGSVVNAVILKIQTFIYQKKCLRKKTLGFW